MKARLFHSSAIAVVAVVLCLATACGTAQAPNSQVNDSKITAQIKTKLAEDVGPSSLTNVNVNTTNGVVTLAGQVETDAVKRHVEEAVMKVSGVIRVDDNLQIEPTGVAQEQHTRTPSSH